MTMLGQYWINIRKIELSPPTLPKKIGTRHRSRLTGDQIPISARRRRALWVLYRNHRLNLKMSSVHHPFVPTTYETQSPLPKLWHRSRLFCEP